MYSLDLMGCPYELQGMSVYIVSAVFGIATPVLGRFSFRKQQEQDFGQMSSFFFNFLKDMNIVSVWPIC